MDRAKVVRGLRIAWTVVFGTLAVLLIVLWVRSHWRDDNFQGSLSATRKVVIVSLWGDVCISLHESKSGWVPWRLSSERIEGPAWVIERDAIKSMRNGFWFSHNGDSAVAIPHWLFAICAGTIAVLPGIQRFSLRTFLIATTAVAAILGIVVWSTGS